MAMSRNYLKELKEVSHRMDNLTGRDNMYERLYDMSKEMWRTMIGCDADGNPKPEEEWVPKFVENMDGLSREEWIEMKKNQVYRH
jgi:hypothetical protein